MSSSELALESVAESLALGIAPESPQPLPLTANSSRCTSPLSPASDRNHRSPPSSADEDGEEGDDDEEEEEEEGVTLNLSAPSKSSMSNLASFLTSMKNGNSPTSTSPPVTMTTTTGIKPSGGLSSQLSSNNHTSFREHDSLEMNGSASSVDEESITTLNLSLPSKSPTNLSTGKGGGGFTSMKLPASFSSSPMGSNLMAPSFRDHEPSGLSRPSQKYKSASSNVHSRGKSKHATGSGSAAGSQLSYAADYGAIPNPQSPDFVQLLLEYRQVLLDMLAKSIMLNDGEGGNSDPAGKSVTIPLKCQCGFNSKLSNQITRSSTYVHQLELRFRSLMEVSRANESKYTPKRPWFINAAHLGSPLAPMMQGQSQQGGKSSLLDKKSVAAAAQQLARQSASNAVMAAKQMSLFRSGNSSINSSMNGDDEDVDSDEDDVNNDRHLTGNLNVASFSTNGSLEEAMNVGSNGGGASGAGKTILEGYLESMKSHLPPSEDGSDDEDKDPDQDCDDDFDGTAGEDDPHRGPGKRIDIKTKKLVVQMQHNGTSFTNISRQIGISRKSVRRIVSNYRAYGMLEKKRESRIQKGTNGLLVQNGGVGGSGGGIGGTALSLQDMFSKVEDDDMDEEKEMVVDEDAGDDDDDQDLEDDEDNVTDGLSIKKELDVAALMSGAYPLALTKPHVKQRKSMSLIHGSFNGRGGNDYPSSQQSPQQAHLSSTNGSQLLNSHLSLIHQAERFKPYDMKMRPSNGSGGDSLTNVHHHRSRSSQIVPPSASSSSSSAKQQLYSLQRQQQQAMRMGGGSNGSSQRAMKPSKMGRHSSEMSIKSEMESLMENMMVPEADKNNNTTLTNCNVTLSNFTNGNGQTASSSNGSAHSQSESGGGGGGSLLPPIPASLADSNSDSEANLVPRSFTDSFPAGIMNSLNPNRATKLTLEDFNVVWQLRSQHWTHNQIRKYFEQRGKSISKSSISRIMNGKQRNFQQFFNVIPSSL